MQKISDYSDIHKWYEICLPGDEIANQAAIKLWGDVYEKSKTVNCHHQLE